MRAVTAPIYPEQAHNAAGTRECFLAHSLNANGDEEMPWNAMPAFRYFFAAPHQQL
jgi:hypothetical protein